MGLRQAVKTGDWYPATPDWIFYVVWPLFLAGFYGAMLVIFRQAPSPRGVVRHLLGLSRLVVDALLFLLAAVWLRRLILYLRGRQQKASKRWPWTAAITLALVTLVGLWLVPTLFPHSWTYQGDLPTKPALIAHRGASMLAPENTLAAVDLAASHQALGVEIDVRLSLDGVPFLMHDDTLARTTNVAEVFPARVQERASSFTLDEIKSLNAGLWYIQNDPFGTIKAGQVSQSQLSINQGQAIPTLAEALEAVKAHGMVIMFDLRYPPAEHPFYDDFFEIVLELCLDARMNSDLWFLLSQEQLPVVMERAPQMTRVAGVSSTDLPDVSTLQALGYEIVNVDHGIRTVDIQRYRAQGLGVNVYTVDEPWLFSQFWLAGVTSVTTNNVHTFNQLDRPVLNVSYARFVLLWGLYGIIVAIWLASSQPEPEPVPPEKMEPVNLMDLDFGPDVIVEVPERGMGQEEDIEASGAWEDAGSVPEESDESQPDLDPQA
jgi:glycerophosphoryl diester phosphodiesterase